MAYFKVLFQHLEDIRRENNVMNHCKCWASAKADIQLALKTFPWTQGYLKCIYLLQFQDRYLTDTLREEYNFRVFENNVLRRIFGPKIGKYQETGKNHIMRSFVSCTPSNVKSDQIKEDEMGKACIMHGRDKKFI